MNVAKLILMLNRTVRELSETVRAAIACAQELGAGHDMNLSVLMRRYANDMQSLQMDAERLGTCMDVQMRLISGTKVEDLSPWLKQSLCVELMTEVDVLNDDIMDYDENGPNGTWQSPYVAMKELNAEIEEMKAML